MTEKIEKRVDEHNKADLKGLLTMYKIETEEAEGNDD